ncbi:hypothetical protein TNCV_2362961 [Trichonephila clavipes]|nr:hypothetical protein TNCV_2362961 [Trichonephila clavipes]
MFVNEEHRNTLNNLRAASPLVRFVEGKKEVHIKSLVYETPVPSVEGSVRNAVAAERKCDMPGIFQSVRNSIQRHCQAYQTISGRKFRQLL